MSSDASRLNVEATTAGTTPVLRVSGEVDLRTSPRLRELLLDAARQRGERLLIDLSQVTYMDSSGVGTMVYVKREVEKTGGQMILIGLQPRVRSVFEITHLDKFFTIVESAEEVA